MIAFQSPLAGVAGLSSVNQRSTGDKSSPGGEDIGEGELNSRERSERHSCSLVGELSRVRQSALIVFSSVFVCLSTEAFSSSLVPLRRTRAKVDVDPWFKNLFKKI
jgi:hypothetical protein